MMLLPEASGAVITSSMCGTYIQLTTSYCEWLSGLRTSDKSTREIIGSFISKALKRYRYLFLLRLEFFFFTSKRSEFQQKTRLCRIFVRIEVVSLRVLKLVQYQRPPIPSTCLEHIFVCVIIIDLKTRDFSWPCACRFRPNQPVWVVFCLQIGLNKKIIHMWRSTGNSKPTDLTRARAKSARQHTNQTDREVQALTLLKSGYMFSYLWVCQ